ncbi:hypothetical protein G9A89_001641 [Geosiphon pyriformis]|nr:hypothetical protein G9A89_001641 [Geosiphon pyriformis]
MRILMSYFSNRFHSWLPCRASCALGPSPRNKEIDSNSRRKSGQKTDCIVSIWNKSEQELLICETIRPPNANDLDHFGYDKIKIQKGLKDILNLIAKRAKFGNVEIFKKLRVYGLHFFGWNDLTRMSTALIKLQPSRFPEFPRSSLDPNHDSNAYSLKTLVNQASDDIDELLGSAVYDQIEQNTTPPTSPILTISATLDTPNTLKRIKHPAM